jgi:cytoskeleton protein RodZ
METLQGGDRRCSIGARLRSARERTGLTPLQAAERLHLDQDVIEALESETFESLGPPVYVRGHLKRYAELVGEQPAELQQNYASRGQMAPMPDLTRIARRAPRDHRRTLASFGTFLAFAILLVGAGWWIARLLRDSAVPIAAIVIGPAAPLDTSAEPRNDSRPLPPEQVASATSTRAEPPATPSAPAFRAAAASSALVLHFTEDSWVEVYDANGARLFYDIGAAGTTRKLTGVAPVRVVLGNAAGVTLEFDGRAAVVPEFAMLDDGQARFVVNRSGRIVRSRHAAGGVNR